MPARIVRVNGLDEAPVAAYAEMRERDRVGREGLFVVEGKVALRVLIDRGHYRLHSLLLSENRVEAVRDVLDRVGVDVTAFVAPQRTMDAIVGFPIHRGVLALAERAPVPCAEDLLQEIGEGRSVIVGLVGIVNHDNVGGIFRNAAAFGASAALLDSVTCDPLYRKAVRVSAGAALFVPFSRSSTPHAMLDALDRAGYETWALSPRGERAIEPAPFTSRRVALLLGAEGAGLPDDVLGRVRTLRIPIANGFDSLNVAVASGIALFAARASAQKT